MRFKFFVKDRGYLASILDSIGVDEGGRDILMRKTGVVPVVVEGVKVPCAIILKQLAISCGADVAIPADALRGGEGEVSVVILATERELYWMEWRAKGQPFGIADFIGEVRRRLEVDDYWYRWVYRGGEFSGREPVVMGILNVTPDSFSDGGKFFNIDDALRRVERMIEEGAQIIDVGGESTRPGAEPVPVEEEIRRVVPVIREIKKRFSVVCSVDTYKASVARMALDEGCEIVNDISGFGFDEEMPKVIAKYSAGVVLMHIKGTPRDMQKDPHYDDVVSEVYRYLEERVNKALDAGIPLERIAVDPGIGFGKRLEDNLVLLKNLSVFRSLGTTVLVGASRKSFIGLLTGANIQDRLPGSLAALGYAVIGGVGVVRVHDVKESVQFLRVMTSIRG